MNLPVLLCRNSIASLFTSTRRIQVKKTLILLFVLVCGIIDNSLAAENLISLHAEIIKRDYLTFYLESESLLPLAAITIVAGGLANGSEDVDLQSRYQMHVKNNTTDSLSGIFKITGSAYVMGPVMARDPYCVSRHRG